MSLLPTKDLNLNDKPNLAEILRTTKYYYKKALEKDNKYYKANINIGHSLFKQAQSLIENGNDTIGIDKLKESEVFYSNSIELTKDKKEKKKTWCSWKK